MQKTKYGRLLIGILCVVLVLLAAFVALYLDSQSPDPIFGIFRPIESPPRPTLPELTPVPDAPVIPPEDLPPVIEISKISFPFEIPGYGLVMERLAPYSGMYVEDGTNINVTDVAMLLVYNKGNLPVEYTQICIRYEQEELLFDISALPSGGRLVVQEKSCKSIPDGEPTIANALVVTRPEMELSADKIKITDNGDNTLTIQNLTGEMIPTVRVFYKYYMTDEQVFVGGIAFTVRLTRLAAGASITIQPSHYNSQTGKVVMVQTYNAEV